MKDRIYRISITGREGERADAVIYRQRESNQIKVWVEITPSSILRAARVIAGLPMFQSAETPGSAMGRIKSARKAEAARENGRRGGRPRKNMEEK